MSGGLGGWDQPAQAVGWQAPPPPLGALAHLQSTKHLPLAWTSPCCPDHWHSCPQKPQQCPALLRSTHCIHQLPSEQGPQDLLCRVPSGTQAAGLSDALDRHVSVTVARPIAQRLTAEPGRLALFSPQPCGLGTTAPPSYR